MEKKNTILSGLKKTLTVALVLVIAAVAVPLTGVNAAKAPKLNKKSATIYVGKTVKLKVKNAKSKVKWTSSNKSVATVSKKGTVTGKKAGKAVVSAKVGSKKLKCKITVKSAPSSSKSKLSPEFKKAMDNYEDFFDEYVSFMKKYQRSGGTDLSLLSDYAKYMQKYADTMKSFEAWENKDMNSAELAYYVDVQARITKKLLEVS